MEMVISINKDDVITEVNKTSAYIGAKTITQDGGNLYYNISTIKEDAEMLERYWREACANVAAVAKEYVSGINSGDTVWEVTLDMPSTYNTSYDGVIKQRMFSYIVMYILLNWLIMCGFDSGVIQIYTKECVDLSDGIDDILHARIFKRADDGPHSENNEYGISEAPDTEDDGDEELSRSSQYGGDKPQNIGEVNVEIIKFRG